MKEINGHPIKLVIREIDFNSFITNLVEFFQNIIKLWCSNPAYNNDKANIDDNNNIVMACVDKQYKLSIIELLKSLEIPLNIILYCIENNSKSNKN